MIAIPAQSTQPTDKVATLFGKADYIAIATSSGQISRFETNDYKNGKDLATWLSMQGVQKIATCDMGFTPFTILNSSKIEVYVLSENLTVAEAVESLAEGRLQKVTRDTIHQLFTQAASNDQACGHAFYF